MAITTKRARKTVEFCTNLTLRDEWEQAGSALDRARAESNAGMEVNPARLEATQRMTAAEEAMRAETVNITIEAVTRKRWQEFVASNPAREGDDTDQALGFNISKVDEILRESIVSVTDHTGEPVDFDPAKEWDALADEMSDGQWQEFAEAAITVNRGITRAPFSQIALQETLRSERN